MKALLQPRYGSAKVLRLAEIERPEPNADEIQIQVHAASLNGSDRENLRGWPAYVRMAGLLRPANPIPGSDIAGVVTAAGDGHTEFKPGEAVFGELPGYRGGLAEYVCTSGATLARKPANLSFAQAATIPQAGAISYRGLVAEGEVEPGKRVLINGAGGSTGSIAVPLARLLGAEVTAVDHGDKLDFLRELGAQRVLDYTQSDFTRTGDQYDLILDVIARRSPAACARALRPAGTYFAVGGPVRVMLAILLRGSAIEQATGKHVRVLAVGQSRDDLLAISAHYESGDLKPFIDRIYPLEQAAEAVGLLAEGRARGKVVVAILDRQAQLN